MAYMYGKIYASLYQGTLRGKAHEILVFTNLIAHADIDSFVDKHWKAIAEEVGLTVDEVKAAIVNLEAPDPDSRSGEEEGRRLVRMAGRTWGWKIVNHAKYRAIRNEEERRIQNREAQERFRNAHSKQSKQSKPRSAEVSRGKPRSAHTDTYTDTDTNADLLEKSTHQVIIQDGIGKHIPTKEQIAKWFAGMKDSEVLGSEPYTQEEVDRAVLSMNERGWTIYGTEKPVADWRAALEKQIKHDRDFRARSGLPKLEKPSEKFPGEPTSLEDRWLNGRKCAIQQGLSIGIFWKRPDDDIERARKIKEGVRLWPHWIVPDDDIERERRLNAGIPLGIYTRPEDLA